MAERWPGKLALIRCFSEIWFGIYTYLEYFRSPHTGEILRNYSVNVQSMPVNEIPVAQKGGDDLQFRLVRNILTYQSDTINVTKQIF